MLICKNEERIWMMFNKRFEYLGKLSRAKSHQERPKAKLKTKKKEKFLNHLTGTEISWFPFRRPFRRPLNWILNTEMSRIRSCHPLTRLFVGVSTVWADRPTFFFSEDEWNVGESWLRVWLSVALQRAAHSDAPNGPRLSCFKDRPLTR